MKLLKWWLSLFGWLLFTTLLAFKFGGTWAKIMFPIASIGGTAEDVTEYDPVWKVVPITFGARQTS